VAWVGEEQAIYSCLYGGEDFELVLCLSEDLAQPLQQELGDQARIIGVIKTVPQVELWPEHNNPIGRTELSLNQGFQHY